MSTRGMAHEPKIDNGASFPDTYTRVEHKHGSRECSLLEERYPGIRFNKVAAHMLARFRFQNSPDQDHIDVSFNLSATEAALKRHGFDKPLWCNRVRTRNGYRLSGAAYDNGLDRVASVFIPLLLARFSRASRR
jgi:hypothetical protein